jgi:hypothetical protein
MRYASNIFSVLCFDIAAISLAFKPALLPRSMPWLQR